MLSERKIKILEYLIYDYITYGEPVSSRTIEKRYRLGISSATIRNEMSDLEELGFIQQPHTSSGRVPTDLGYRLYVDRLVLRDITAEEQVYLKNIVLTNINHMEYLMKETAKALSLLTKYTTIVSEATHNKLKIQRIQLMPMDSTAIVVVVITVTKLIKNSFVSISKPLNDETLNNLTTFLNSLIKGKTSDEISKLNVQDIPYKNLIKNILVAVIDILTLEEEIEIFTSGVNNILAFPEFNNIEKAKNIFKTLEQKDLLVTLLGDNTADNITVVIGNENSLEEMKDCSIIQATYKQNNQALGAIGIIGPTRMDYIAVASVLNAVVTKINTVLQGNILK